MNLEAMIRQYRVAAHDTVEPYFFADDDLIPLFNEAQHEAVTRGRLIHEAQDPAVCEIAVTAGQAVYPLHPALYELTHIRLEQQGSHRSQSIRLSSTEELDRVFPQWREITGRPEYAVQDDTALRLVPKPEAGGTLRVEGYRLPLSEMTDVADEPEINAAHHRHLHQWVLFRVFSVPDAEVFDPSRAALAESEFTRYFGLRPDSDLRRIVREDEPHHVQPFFV